MYYLNPNLRLGDGPAAARKFWQKGISFSLRPETQASPPSFTSPCYTVV